MERTTATIYQSGNERAVWSGLEVLKPRGVLFRLGLGGDVAIPQNMVVAKEIEMKGTFRFHEEFSLAVDLIGKRRVDLKPLLTGTFPLDDAVNAFETSGRRTRYLGFVSWLTVMRQITSHSYTMAGAAM